MNTLADRIKERMQYLRISQERLAERTGLSQPAISHLLTGQTQRTRHLPKLAEALQVSVDWLAKGDGPANDQLPAEVRTALRRLRQHAAAPLGITAARAVNAILEDQAPYDP
jgi:transcriptional regulator with XRE-family HTH domain